MASTSSSSSSAIQQHLENNEQVDAEHNTACHSVQSRPVSLYDQVADDGRRLKSEQAEAADPSGCDRLAQLSQPLLNTGDIAEALKVNDDAEEAIADDRMAPVTILFGSIEFLSPWFPSIDPKHHTFRTRRSRRKTVIWMCFGTALSITIFNFIMTLVTWLHYPKSFDGVVTVYHGDCDVSKHLDTGIHLLINILSTLLLSASNLCLQLVLAPTRAEVNRAHSNNQWLDIGVPSWRNLHNLPRSAVIVWLCLAFSSIPIHFLYNSTIFSTVSTNSYLYATVTEAFLVSSDSGTKFELSNGTIVPAPTDISKALNATVQFETSQFGFYGEKPERLAQQKMVQIHDDVQANLHLYQNVSNLDCLQDYFPYSEWRPHVLLVSDDIEKAVKYNTSLLTWGTNGVSAGNEGSLNPISWSNDSQTSWEDISTINSSTMAEWAQRGNHIQYCLRRLDDLGEGEFKDCRVQCAPQVLLVTTIFNAIKCAGILFVLYGRPEKTLCTLGDAVASFLEDPDPYTEGCGVTTKNSVQLSQRKEGKWCLGSAQQWSPLKTAWYQAASPRRWWFTMSTSLAVLILGTVVLGTGLAISAKYEHSTSFQTLWSLGFGTTNYREIISWHQPTNGKWGLFTNIVLANVWQVLVSLCYVAQNALLSCLLVADEWTGFAKDRKTLRVSHPQGIQRSTYFVSMPWKYGIPSMVLFSLLHWLLSQSTFIIRVVNIDIRTSPPIEVEGWTTSGFSLVPAIFALILSATLLIAQTSNAFIRKHPTSSAMPLVSTCSAAISANCHRPEADSEAHLLPVQWGVVNIGADGCQLCSFTTLRNVSSPEAGSRVLGMPDL